MSGKGMLQMPSQRPGFGIRSLGDAEFNKKMKDQENLYLDYLKTYTKVAMKLERDERVELKEFQNMDELLTQSGHESTRRPLRTPAKDSMAEAKEAATDKGKQR